MASCDAELKNSRAGEGDHTPTSALARSMSSSLNWKSVAFSNSADVVVVAMAPLSVRRRLPRPHKEYTERRDACRGSVCGGSGPSGEWFLKGSEADPPAQGRIDIVEELVQRLLTVPEGAL